MKKIAFVASECQPFITSGGLADVIGSLPKEIVKQSTNYELCVFLPMYKTLNQEYIDKLSFVTSLTVNLSWRKQLTKVYSYIQNNITYYFIDNSYYFGHDELYGYYDDAERFAFFSKAVIDTILKLGIKLDIIHCHDWQTGMVPVYLRTLYYDELAFKNTLRIFTIHNIEYQGKYSFDSNILEDIFGISNSDGYLLEYDGLINIMKGAMECSNIVSTVSPTYAKEILTKEYAHGLEYEVERVEDEGKLVGILNGIDYEFYNPKTDTALFNKFNSTNLSLRKENKVKLLQMLDFNSSSDSMLIGMVTRLVWHKGLDIIKRSINELLKRDVKLLILGTGDKEYEEFFKECEKKHPDKLKVILAFNQDLSRKIYSGVDFFLMPSESEPCGLSQMIASHYGAIPMVRETGGLKDSIIDFSNKNGNGLTFKTRSEDDLVKMIDKAISYYKSNDFESLQQIVMNKDFSWSASAKKYIKLYDTLLK